MVSEQQQQHFPNEDICLNIGNNWLKKKKKLQIITKKPVFLLCSWNWIKLMKYYFFTPQVTWIQEHFLWKKYLVNLLWYFYIYMRVKKKANSQKCLQRTIIVLKRWEHRISALVWTQSFWGLGILPYSHNHMLIWFDPWSPKPDQNLIVKHVTQF